MTAPASLLPSNASRWMLAVEQTSAERRPLPADVIRMYWDPYRIPAEDLHVLAHALSVDIWNEAWPEEKKRDVLAQWPEIERLKGTQEGIQRLVEIAGGRVLEFAAPPEAMFLAGPVDPAAQEAYIRRLPEVRLYFASEKAEDDGGLWLDADCFLDVDFLTPDRGEAIAGRRGVLYRDGVETPLRTYSTRTTIEERRVVVYEQMALPGEAGAALFLDDGYLDDGFVDGAAKAAEVISYRLDRAYFREDTDYPITTVTPGFQPVTPRYERGSNPGDAGAALILDVDFLDDDRFLVPDAADELVFDSLRLFDPEVDAPFGQGDDFLDASRLGMRPFTLELLVLADRKSQVGELFLGDGFLDVDFLVPDDITPALEVMRAVAAGRSKRDQVLISFDPERPRLLTDGISLDGSFRFGAKMRRQL